MNTVQSVSDAFVHLLHRDYELGKERRRQGRDAVKERAPAESTEQTRDRTPGPQDRG